MSLAALAESGTIENYFIREKQIHGIDFEADLLEDLNLENLNLVVPIPIKQTKPQDPSRTFRSPPMLESEISQMVLSSPASKALEQTINASVELIDRVMNSKLLPVSPTKIDLKISEASVPKIQNCSLVAELIERFLRGRIILQLELDQLEPNMLLVLDCLMKRKLGCSVADYIRNIDTLKCASLKGKRLEENYKMIFKSAFKHLSSRFRISTKGKRSKSDEASFYAYYFSEKSDTVDIPLESFFHPNRKLKSIAGKAGANQKTMNSKYLENLMTSKKFCSDLMDYLDKKFVSSYEDKRLVKIESFVDKVKTKFLEVETPNLEELKYYLERNSKCKLPWSNYELKIAKQNVLQLYKQRMAISNAEKSFIHSGNGFTNGRSDSF